MSVSRVPSDQTAAFLSAPDNRRNGRSSGDSAFDDLFAGLDRTEARYKPPMHADALRSGERRMTDAEGDAANADEPAAQTIATGLPFAAPPAAMAIALGPQSLDQGATLQGATKDAGLALSLLDRDPAAPSTGSTLSMPGKPIHGVTNVHAWTEAAPHASAAPVAAGPAPRSRLGALGADGIPGQMSAPDAIDPADQELLDRLASPDDPATAPVAIAAELPPVGAKRVSDLPDDLRGKQSAAPPQAGLSAVNENRPGRGQEDSRDRSPPRSEVGRKATNDSAARTFEQKTNAHAAEEKRETPLALPQTGAAEDAGAGTMGRQIGLAMAPAREIMSSVEQCADALASSTSTHSTASVQATRTPTGPQILHHLTLDMQTTPDDEISVRLTRKGSALSISLIAPNDTGLQEIAARANIIAERLAAGGTKIDEIAVKVAPDQNGPAGSGDGHASGYRDESRQGASRQPSGHMPAAREHKNGQDDPARQHRGSDLVV